MGFPLFKSLNARTSHLLAAFARRFPRIARLLGVLRGKRRPLLIVFQLVMHGIGFVMSINAVMQTRTEQGAVAWAISLNTLPVIAVPAYAIFGDSHVESYIAARNAGLEKIRPFADRLLTNLEQASATSAETHPTMATLSKLASMPVMTGNRAALLVDGKNTFDSIFKAIDAAEDYILIQFYILRADEIGNQLKTRLIEKAQAGVRVYLLTDDVGSLHLTDDYLAELRDAGVSAEFFMTTSGKANRFQLNFRNHRKIVVIDGKVAFLGGHNVGDEYLGLHPTLTPWRDSHIVLEGPVVKSIQIPFVEDWHWATGELLEDLDWEIRPEDSAGDMKALALASGPADPVETCSMFFLTAINEATDRVWIASPYFVPDDKMVTALQLAAIRGVDVRVIMPEQFDSRLVYFSSFSYLKELSETGVKLYRYQKGFMHQKVVLVDDAISAVGSANFDNRSFRLNFEITGIIHDEGFAASVAQMLETDLGNSIEVDGAEYLEKPFTFRLVSRLSRLLAPIQ